MQQLSDEVELSFQLSATSTTMGSEHAGQKRKVYNPNTKGEIFLHIATASQICILLFVTLILYLCFSAEFTFFTWHPLLLSIGWTFLMSEAILSMSKDNFFCGTLPKSARVRLHWILQTIALALITTSFIVVFVNKNNLNKNHFVSWHGLLGFIGIVSSIPTCLNGTLTLFHVELKHYIAPKLNKLIHVTCGIITFACGGTSLILSVYTKWFERHTGGSWIVFLFGFVMATTVVAWTLVRPFFTFSGKLKQVF